MSRQPHIFQRTADGLWCAKVTVAGKAYTRYAATPEKKLRTHEQVRCPGCGLLAIWKKRETPLTEAEVDLMLAPGG